MLFVFGGGIKGKKAAAATTTGITAIRTFGRNGRRNGIIDRTGQRTGERILRSSTRAMRKKKRWRYRTFAQLEKEETAAETEEFARFLFVFTRGTPRFGFFFLPWRAPSPSLSIGTRRRRNHEWVCGSDGNRENEVKSPLYSYASLELVSACLVAYSSLHCSTVVATRKTIIIQGLAFVASLSSCFRRKAVYGMHQVRAETKLRELSCKRRESEIDVYSSMHM